jgi:hypothetical protein
MRIRITGAAPRLRCGKARSMVVKYLTGRKGRAMNHKVRLALSASLLALTASGATAQEFYLGLALEIGDPEMTDITPTTYPGDLTMGSVLAGVRFPTANGFFFGAEAETSLFTNYDTATFGGDEVDRISRLRALAGYDFQTFSLFAAAGRSWLDGLPAGPGLEGGAQGNTFGLGAEIPVSERIDFRLEAIHDDLNFENGSYSWDNTALRLGAIIKF